MAVYCLDGGTIQEVTWEDVSGWQPEAVFHLDAEGTMHKVHEIPVLSPGEGVLAYSGEFYIEALEIQIEFLKAANAKCWLEALVLRHADRVKNISENVSVVAGIQGVGI